MTLGALCARFRDRERALRQDWFPERQFILRGGDRVRALTLSPGFQMAIVAVSLVALLLSLGTTTGFFANRSAVGLAKAETDRLRIAYSQLIDEVSQQHSKVLGITHDLEHYRTYLLTLLEQNQGLRRDLRSFASQLELPDNEKQRTAAAEEALRGQLEGMERDLVGVNQRNELLQSNVSEMRSRLEATEGERARFAAARAALDRRLARLEQDATGAQSHSQELERALTAKQQLVEQAQTARKQALQERDLLTIKLADAEQRVQQMTKAHEIELTRLSEQTRNTITEVERIVSATGLDGKRLVPVRDTRRQNRGGPFVPWSARPRAPEDSAPNTSLALHSDIARLDDLRQLLRVLPLASPVKTFSITSPFGYRVDPFNNLGAFHEGLDMQAPFHTKVSATAPGKVVFAGWHASYGRLVELDHGYGVRTRYAHLDRIAVTEGASVARGDEVGLLGGTGRTSGIHLHYEVLVDGRPRDPVAFLKATADVLKNK